MTAFILVISYLAGIVTVIDMVRRPQSAWVAADRDRTWWVSGGVILSVFACGLIVAIAYAVAVLPHFSSETGVDHDFRKRW